MSLIGILGLGVAAMVAVLSAAVVDLVADRPVRPTVTRIAYLTGAAEVARLSGVFSALAGVL